jgi:salicylate hydroxylase
MAADLGTRDLIEPAKITCWMGPYSHVVCYNLDSKGIYNVVLTKSEDSLTQRMIGPQPVLIDDCVASFPNGTRNWDAFST